MRQFNTLKIDESTPFTLTIMLNRPSVKNAINSEMMRELADFWQLVSNKKRKWRCIILTGSETAFCSGADLKERKNMDLKTWKAHHAVLVKAMRAMRDCPVPVIAAVNGPAYGGGLELVLASDFAYAASTAVFSQSEVKMGLIPGALGTQNLPRTVGLKWAKELAFTADSFSAEKAYELGIINKICQPEELMQQVKLTASKICDNAPLAVREVKKALNMSQQLNIQSGFNFEKKAYHRVLLTQDRKEGIKAFNEKRKPIFVGE